MKPYTYHSPEGDRPVFAKEEPKSGIVDLFTSEGALDIGKCPVGGAVGQCEPTKAEAKEEPKEEPAAEDTGKKKDK